MIKIRRALTGSPNYFATFADYIMEVSKLLKNCVLVRTDAFTRTKNGVVTDTQVIQHVLKHLRIRDAFKVDHVIRAAFVSLDILGGHFTPPKGNWYYRFKR